MLKKTIALLTALLLVFSLTACGQSETTETAQPETTGTEAAEDAAAPETPEETTDGTEDAQETEPDAAESETAEEPDAADGADEERIDTGEHKILVVYFTRSGNTEEIASYIARQTGAELYQIEPLTPYPEEYEEVGEVAEQERDENARPEIKDPLESVEEYDTIFVGYPIRWHTAPMIIGTFLESYDLTGKEIYPLLSVRFHGHRAV